MEDIQCIFCHKSSHQTVIEENGYQGRKCPSCGLIYISPRPSFLEIQNLYSQDKAHVSAESHISGAFIKMLYAKHTLQIIKKFIRTGSLLEIGAGAGYFLDEARKEGFDVYGIELNNIQANFIRNKLGIPCEESPLDVSSFCEKKFDIIYHCDVISHFFDPIAEFKNIHDTLLDNGIVVFETGNVGDIKEKYYRIFASFHYPDHMFFFSENNLMELLRLTGFEFIRIYRYSILTQLLFNKILKRVMDSMKSQGKIRDIRKKGIPEVPSSNINGFNLKQLARIAFYLFSYLIRYKIGYIMPKKGRPQTVIIIARKIK